MGKSVALVFICSCLPTGHTSISSAEAGGARVPQIPESSSLYHTLSQKVDALELQLAQEQEQRKQALANRRTEYETRVGVMQEENRAIAAESVEISRKINEVKDTNARLRAEGDTLLKENGAWQGDWAVLGANLSTALEVANTTLRTLEVQPPELAVLRQLDEQEALQRATADHLDRLAEIAPWIEDKDMAPPKASYLQLAHASVKRRGGSSNVSTFSKVLQSGFDDLAAVYREKQEELDNEYRAKLRDQVMHRKGLLAEQNMLNATLANAALLQERLQAAVAHLQELNAKLMQRGLSIRRYVELVGNRALPGDAASTIADNETASVISSLSFSLDGALSEVGGINQSGPAKLDQPLQYASNVSAQERPPVPAKTPMQQVAQAFRQHGQRTIQGLSKKISSGRSADGERELPLPAWLKWLR